MATPIRIKGRITRSAEWKPKNIFLPDKMIAELKEKYDANSDQALFFALMLDALGDVNLKKEKSIDVEDYVDRFKED